MILKRKLGYSLNNRETTKILKEKSNKIMVDGKVRRDPKYPVGLMDVLTIENTKDKFRLFYDEKRRFTLLKIKDKEVNSKLCKIVRYEIGANKIPYIITHDARTIRYPDPAITVGDTIQYDFEKGVVEKHFKLAVGHKALVTSGNNLGRIGLIQSIVKKMGNVAVITIKDEAGHVFNTRIGNVFVIGDSKVACTLPKGKGIRYTVGEVVHKLIEHDEKEEAH